MHITNPAEQQLFPTPAGLYCPSGGFYIDPVKPVDHALITHGHADHAIAGHRHVMATRRTLEIMAIRYGPQFCGEQTSAALDQSYEIGNAIVSFHSAGHVLGSAQIALKTAGLRFVISGDYKRLPDPTAETFKVIPCDIFITEATFGLPIFRHPNPKDEIQKLITSLSAHPSRAHMVGTYALGKAQRIIRLLRDNGYDRPVFLHGALIKLCAYYEAEGIALGPLIAVTEAETANHKFAGEIVLAPPSTFNGPWMKRFADPLICFASGWMHIKQRAKQRGVELPLVISDHSDWQELTETILETKASEIWVTHGREEALIRWCALNQIKAKPLHLVGYDEEAE